MSKWFPVQPLHIFKKLTLLKYNLHIVKCYYFKYTVQWVLIKGYIHVINTPNKIPNISITPESSLVHLCSISSHAPSQEPIDLTSATTDKFTLFLNTSEVVPDAVYYFVKDLFHSA